jgi:pyruvate dehydrogenase E2 component (dihydrolipoamide acetyltransferase)
MATAITMPKWGMIMETGIIVNWIKEVGEEIERDEVILEIESEKVVNEFNSPVSGILYEIIVDEGEEVEVGKLIGIILNADEDEKEAEKLKLEYQNTPPPQEKGDSSTSIGESRSELASTETPAAVKNSERKAVSPAAKKIIRDANLDINGIQGTGPGGRITVEDAKGAIRKSEAIGIPLSSVRKVIAARTLASIQAPQAALCKELDITNLLRMRKINPASLTAFFVKLTADALKKVPILNSRLNGDNYTTDAVINIGVVIQSGEAIVIPVISDAGNKTLDVINTELRELVDKGKKGLITGNDLRKGTFTISNAGNSGIDFFQPLLNPPEVASLGIGAAKKRAVVIDDNIVIRSTAWFCLSTDHRLVDAEPAGKFLQNMDELLIQLEDTPDWKDR